jgi:hypothetical protein
MIGNILGLSHILCTVTVDEGLAVSLYGIPHIIDEQRPGDWGGETIIDKVVREIRGD